MKKSIRILICCIGLILTLVLCYGIMNKAYSAAIRHEVENLTISISGQQENAGIR